MKLLGAFLTLVAIACGFIGIVFSTQATIGVGLICLGAISGILARLCQADAHHTEILSALGNIQVSNNAVKHIIARANNIRIDEK